MAKNTDVYIAQIHCKGTIGFGILDDFLSSSKYLGVLIATVLVSIFLYLAKLEYLAKTQSLALSLCHLHIKTFPYFIPQMTKIKAKSKRFI